MPDEERIEVAIVGDNVYLKPFGRACQNNCLGLPDFLDGMFREGCVKAAFDLADCTGMDSSFLGVIASAATVDPQRIGQTVVILNASAPLIVGLQRVGLLQLVNVIDEPVTPPEDVALRPVDLMHLPSTERQRISQIKVLHEHLAKLNDKNKVTFGPFLKMLDAELQD
jgi:anti-sigma B factor antagonist